MKWENRDWIWLLILMIFVMGTSHMYKGQFLNLVSYASTFVSIALAFIAIYISVREATKADKIKDETLMTLGEMKEKLGQLDTKVSSIDLNRIKQGIDEAVSNFKQELEENKSDWQSDDLENPLIDKLDDKLSQLSEEIKSTLTAESSYRGFLQIDSFLETSLLQVYRKLSNLSANGKFSFRAIYSELLNRLADTRYSISKNEVNVYVFNHVVKGVLMEYEDGSYKLRRHLE